jgi:DNA polymerase-3 subunit epsilon
LNVWRRIFGPPNRNGKFPSETSILDQRYVVVDTELTSLDKRSNRVLSIGAVAMEGAKILLAEEFYREINPGVAIPSETILIHRLRPADVERAEEPKQALLDLKRFAEGAVLVGHFVSIDVDALQKELSGHGHALDNPFIDTAKVHRWLLRHSQYAEDPGHRYEQVDLLSLANHYHLTVQELHHALADAFVTAQLWQKLLHAAEKQGIRTLGELLRIGR